MMNCWQRIYLRLEWELPSDYEIEERHAKLGPYVWSKNLSELQRDQETVQQLLWPSHEKVLQKREDVLGGICRKIQGEKSLRS